MYLMYVDESGDPGNNTAQSDYFCLSGLIVHESEWRTLIDVTMRFRRTMKDVYGLPVRSEIHTVKFLRHSNFAIEKHKRLAILRNYLDEISKMNFLSLTNVVVDKRGKPAAYDVFSSAWRTLFQRFENTLIHGNFPGGYKRAYGTVFTDATNGEKLTGIMRKMSVYNPIPNRWGGGFRNMPILRIIEDPSSRNSEHSLPIQSCDVVAYFLHQSLKPNSYVKRVGAQKYFQRLEPVLNKNASIANPLGIVML
jgi:Protein of unknown function (DUF3800)